jgi:hypothetical protein
MSVINALEAILQRNKAAAGADSGELRLHVIDLCCGKSLTGCLITLLHPEFIVHTVDKLTSAALPHYPADLPDCEGGGNLKYLQRDLFDSNFVEAMGEVIEQIGLPTVVLGMHLCGNLSIQAIEMLHCTPLVSDLVLCPCCLPNQNLDTSSTTWYASSVQDDQYDAWVAHLGECMAPHTVRVEHNAHMLTVKATLIHGHKKQHVEQYKAKVVPADMGNADMGVAETAASDGSDDDERNEATTASSKKTKTKKRSDSKGKTKQQPSPGGRASAASALHASFSVHVRKLSVRSPSEQASGQHHHSVERDHALTGASMEVADLPSRTYEGDCDNKLTLEVPLAVIEQGGRIHIDAILVNRGTREGSCTVTAHMCSKVRLAILLSQPVYSSTPATPAHLHIRRLTCRSLFLSRAKGVGLTRLKKKEAHSEWATGHPIFFRRMKGLPPSR